jgi:hypothetical protein
VTDTERTLIVADVVPPLPKEEPAAGQTSRKRPRDWAFTLGASKQITIRVSWSVVHPRIPFSTTAP